MISQHQLHTRRNSLEMKFEEDDDDSCKRNKPSFASGEDHNAPVKKSKISEKDDLELMMKTDSEISQILARTKKHLQLLGDKLPDKGDKMKANLRRYEDELQRRNKLQSNKKDSATSSPDCVAEDKPSEVDIQVKEAEDLELVMKTESKIRDTTAEHKKNLQTFGDKLPDKDDLIKAAPCRNQYELERRNILQSNKKDSIAYSPDCLAGIKPLESHTNALTVDADPLTDEKMQKIVNELVNVGISETDVGKAAEICYNDPVKVKVLFALPSHMRNSYVCGFFH